MAPLEQNITPGSVLTIIAARPETQWLKRVSSEEGEAAGDLASMVPEATGMVAVKRREPEPGEPDTGETVSGLYTQSLLPGAGARSKKVLPMAAAVVAAAAMALVGAVVVLGHDDDAPLPEAPPDAVVDKAASPASSDPSPAEMASPSPPEGKAAPGEATNDEDEQADAPPDPEADESSRPPKRAERGASRSRSAPGLAIQTRGPSSVVWKVGRKKLGKGNGTVKAPAGTSVLVALDTSTGGLTQVPVKNGAADYASVGKGTLSLRIKPWAKASIGGRTLGTTPLDPVSLPAGRYQVKLVWNDVVKTETVTVQAGRTAVVKADMRK